MIAEDHASLRSGSEKPGSVCTVCYAEWSKQRAHCQTSTPGQHGEKRKDNLNSELVNNYVGGNSTQATKKKARSDIVSMDAEED